MTANPFEGHPDMLVRGFPEGLEWLNVEKPLTMAALRGKIILLDFWTYGCINCIHMIPVLKQLERNYPDELVVIGVHSAKFSNEGQTQNIRDIIGRYELHHPVINDHEFLVWRMFQVQAWPTFAIIDPLGRLLAMQSGEIPVEGFDQLISGMIEHYDATGDINREPLSLRLEGAGQPDPVLSYPGKVLADETGGRLFIADSGHHRIVVMDLESQKIIRVIGSGQQGFVDGDSAMACFNKPQGMALQGDRLFVADTNNHAVRVVDLKANQVETLAGTGEMAQGVVPFGAKIREPKALALRSPWDVCLGAEGTLFIAMAGAHQIWEMNLETRVMRVSVGNGREAATNATLATSELAQPSGLYFEEGLLYFADSESSTIRVADYTNDSVNTLAGTLENNLFRFGDADGLVGHSLLQHPLDITGDGQGMLYIADTYNSKIKQLDSTTQTTRLFGVKAGFADGDLQTARFNEPGGLSYASGRLYVADTNNNAIRVIDLNQMQVRTLRFANPEALLIGTQSMLITRTQNAHIQLPEQRLKPGENTLHLEFSLPEAYKLNPDVASSVHLRTEGDALSLEVSEISLSSLHTSLGATSRAGTAILHLEVVLYACEQQQEKLCTRHSCEIDIPLRFEESAESGDLHIRHHFEHP